MRWLTLIAAVVMAFAAPAFAQEDQPSGAERYAACLQSAGSDPAAAERAARTWIEEGGGAPAQHCLAVAKFSAGNYPGAAEILEGLGRDTANRADERAGAWAQAGQAWLLADRHERALIAQNNALSLTPNDLELLIDRSFTKSFLGKHWEALDDLNKAAELAPERADIFVYRAATYRALDTPELAQDDVNRALELYPDMPEGLLERGLLRRKQGDGEGARADLRRVIEIAPDEPVAEMARDALTQMDAQGE